MSLNSYFSIWEKDYFCKYIIGFIFFTSSNFFVSDIVFEFKFYYWWIFMIIKHLSILLIAYFSRPLKYLKRAKYF